MLRGKKVQLMVTECLFALHGILPAERDDWSGLSPFPVAPHNEEESKVKRALGIRVLVTYALLSLIVIHSLLVSHLLT